MSKLFLEVVNRSIAAGWLVLAVLVLRLIFKKAPRWVNILLWGIVAVRLSCPFTIQSAWSLIPSAETIPERVLSGPSFDIQTGITPVDDWVNDYLGDRYFEGVSVPVKQGAHMMTVFAALWTVGVLFLTVYAVVVYWRLRSRVKTAVLYRDNIFQSENVEAPFVLGVIRPRIYLPFRLDGQAMEYVAAHEQAHIRRRDHWWKPLGFLLLTVYWFNPLMWAAYVLLCRDIELACDEKVIKGLDSGQRAGYTQALLDCSVGWRVIAACPLAFGEVGVKARVKAVMKYRKPALWIIAAALIVCIVVSIGFLTDPAAKRASLKWARELSAGEISGADFVVFTYRGSKFRSLAEEELAGMAALINRSRGKYQPEPEALDGGSKFFYIRMKDGTSHSVGNIGNTYLVIDEDYYEADYRLLVIWDEAFEEGSVGIPDGYFGGTADGGIRESAAIRPVDETLSNQDREKHPASKVLPPAEDPAPRIAGLFDTIESSPAFSSLSRDYIKAHEEEYQELLSYGEDTLRYCFSEFLQGGQTGLRGHLMAAACVDIGGAWGEALLGASWSGQTTGQGWFDQFKAGAEELSGQLSQEELKKMYPASWLLLEMSKSNIPQS